MSKELLYPKGTIVNFTVKYGDDNHEIILVSLERDFTGNELAERIMSELKADFQDLLNLRIFQPTLNPTKK